MGCEIKRIQQQSSVHLNFILRPTLHTRIWINQRQCLFAEDFSDMIASTLSVGYSHSVHSTCLHLIFVPTAARLVTYSELGLVWVKD